MKVTKLNKIKEAIKILKPYSEIKPVEDKLLIVFKPDKFLIKEFEKELDQLTEKLHWTMLNRATDEELKKNSKVVDYKYKRDYLRRKKRKGARKRIKIK